MKRDTVFGELGIKIMSASNLCSNMTSAFMGRDVSSLMQNDDMSGRMELTYAELLGLSPSQLPRQTSNQFNPKVKNPKMQNQ